MYKVPSGFQVALFALLLTISQASTALAEDIIYSGGALDTVGGSPNSLAPAGSATGKSTTVSENNVTVNGVSVEGSVFGAINLSDANSVTGNTVTINSGSTVGGIVTGGRASSGVATGNTVTLSGGTVGGIVTGGETSSGAATGNTVTLGGGAVGGHLMGGRTTDGTATGNSIIIEDGSVGGFVAAGLSSMGGATGNSVTMSGGIVTEFVAGGDTDVGAATGNSVTISGGTVNGYVMGGRTDTGSATGNSVTLSGGTLVASVYGGLYTSSSADVFTGNTLNVMVPGLHIGEDLKNFQYLNFYVPSTAATGTTMLNVVGEANLTDDAGRSSTVNVGIAGGSSSLQAGDKIVLINAGTLVTNGGLNTTANGQGMQGVSLLYDFAIQTEGNKLLAIVPSGGATVNPRTKALAEGRVSGLGFVNQGAELAAGQGLGSALAATAQMGKQGAGAGNFAAFGAMSGGSSRYNTGSHTDVDGFFLLTGLGWRAPLQQHSLLLGAFFEAGWGNYDSHNSFSNAASVKGSGDIDYYGGGILGRYALTEGCLAGLYGEVSFRAGYVSTDFNSSDLRDATGQRASYDSGAAYSGAHTGLGYVWNLTEKTSLDFSSKYLWTHQESDSVTVVGDPIRFKAADSQRWRNGARFAYAIDTQSGMQWKPYIGAYHEYEFDGKARATTYGRSIEAPTLRGGTGVGEVGVGFTPAAGCPVSMDLGVQGYTGVREGVGGNMQLKYAF